MTMELIVGPDVEAWAVEYLSEGLAALPDPVAQGVLVATRVPTERAPRMVVVRRDGGTRLDIVREVARLGVRVWGGTDEEVSDLTALVRALLFAAPGHGPVRRVAEIAGPAYLLEDSGQPLKFFTVELTVKGAARS